MGGEAERGAFRAKVVLTVRMAVPRPRRVPQGSVSREVSPVSRAWERGAPGCWWSRTGCPRSWPLLPGGFCQRSHKGGMDPGVPRAGRNVAHNKQLCG